MAVAQRGKLAHKILFWFLSISLIPMGIVGYQLISISQKSLRKETLAMQESLAVGFADTVRKFVMTFKNVLAETAGIEEFSSMDPLAQRQYLNRIMQVHLAVLELSISDTAGVEIMRTGRFLGSSPSMRKFSNDDFFTGATSRGIFIGRLERFQGLYPTVTMAVAIVDRKTQPATTVGVLMAKVSLNGLSQMLGMEFPEEGHSSAAVIAPDGFIVAHSKPKEVFRPDAQLNPEIVRVITTQSESRGGGKIKLSSGLELFGAYSDVKDLGWVVYVEQPLAAVNQTSHDMIKQILVVLLVVAVVVIIVSLLLSSHITQPVRELRNAAARIGKGQFEDLPQLELTGDEIGDLAQTFLAMKDSLQEKTGELVHAKQELEKFTKFLERRVEARTRELKSAQDELIKKERLAAIGQMAAVVGHEIRNPLAVINNSIYFIKTKLSTGPGAESLDPKITKHIKIIESEIQQANGIINEILTYSRQRELKPERMQLNAFVEELLSVYPFPDQIQVAKTLTPANPVVDIDSTEFRQAVRNLIGNGIEVMPKGGVITVQTEVVGSEAMLLIADAGSGIPPDVLDKVFAPFFTTKARGTGLGLAVVKKVIDRHNGRIEVGSEVGKGTTFKLYIPIAKT